MKRAQLSLFLIIIAIVVIALGASIIVAERLAPQNAAKTVTTGESRTGIRLCLEEAGKQAIMQTMAQGGVNTYLDSPKNAEQREWGSKSRLEDPVTGGTYKMDLAKTPPDVGEGDQYPGDGVANTARPNPPSYLPFNGVLTRVGVQRNLDFSYNDPNVMAPEYGSIPTPYELRPNKPLGNLSFEPLCSLFGYNKPDADNTGRLSCLFETYDIANHGTDLKYKSIQTALEERINATIANEKLCEVKAPIQVAFGEDDVTIIAGNDSAKIPIRLKRLYNAAFMTARAEIENLSFKLVDGISTPSVPGCSDPKYGNNCIIPGFVMKVEREGDSWEDLSTKDQLAMVYPDTHKVLAAYYEPDAVDGTPDPWQQPITRVSIIDTDPQRKIDGKSPAFSFLVKNRYPMIWKTPASSMEDSNRDNRPIDAVAIARLIDPDDVGGVFSCGKPTAPLVAGWPIWLYKCGDKLVTDDPAIGTGGTTATITVEPQCVRRQEVHTCNPVQATTWQELIDANRPGPTCVPWTPTGGIDTIICSGGTTSIPTNWQITNVNSPDFPRNCRKMQQVPVTVGCYCDVVILDSKPPIDPVTEPCLADYTCNGDAWEPVQKTTPGCTP